MLLAGCGSAPKTTEGLKQVTGKVTYKGQPLTSGVVTFVAEGRGLSASSPIDEQGQFKLMSDARSPGAKPGAYKVRIESWTTPPAISEGNFVAGKSAVPEKYGDPEKSGLTATVKEEDPQTIDLTVTD